MSKRIWDDETGLLTFEWILMISVLVIGVIAGLAAVRDSLNAELLDLSQSIGLIDQGYRYDGLRSEVVQGEGQQGNMFFDVARVAGSSNDDDKLTAEMDTLPPVEMIQLQENGPAVPARRVVQRNEHAPTAPAEPETP